MRVLKATKKSLVENPVALSEKPGVEKSVAVSENPVALKGRGLNRATDEPKETAALAAEGMPVVERIFPQGLKPTDYMGVSREAEASRSLRKTRTRVFPQPVKPRPFKAKVLRALDRRVPQLSIFKFRKDAGRTASLAVLLAIALTGCKPVGPNYNRPGYEAPPAYKETGASAALVPPPNPNGGAWQPASPSDGMLREKWWEIYQDPQLNRLEELVTPQNQSLRAALETYLAARNQVSIARADFYPTLAAGPTVSHDRASAHRPNAVPGAKTNYNDLQLEGQASWEPDFWSRIRRTVEAARDNAQASAADMANLDLSLHAELAQDYFELRGLDSQSRLLQSTVTDYEHQLDLNQRLLKGGLATEVVVAQALTQLQTVRAQLIDINEARAEYEHAIATLVNQHARDLTLEPSPLDLALPKVPIGVPSQLIERRPDISAAERRIAAANAQIGIAISAFYPTITLGGGGGFESTHGGTWIQGPSSLWSLGAQATELLFDAGRRHALSLDLSNKRYKGGVTSYLEVLTAESALLTNQRTATDLQTRQFAASVQLIRALGGGWDVSQLPK